jgi:G3E family GTPase
MTPVTIVTGFLGSGKTTLISRLLRHEAMARAAVIVNEFGEVGLDHALVERIEGDVILLPQGCLCCMLNGTLANTLESLDARRINGEIPSFDRVIVETSGIASPAPALQTLLDRSVLLRGYVPGLIAATVDAVNAHATLARHAEAVQQVAVADRLLITKPDLAPAGPVRAQLAELNPAAPVCEVLHGDLAPEIFTASSAGDVALLHKLRMTRFAAGHAARIGSVCLRLKQDPPFATLADFLGDLVAAHGESLLRVKGIVRVQGEGRPLAVHGVQHVFHPPTRLAAWPESLPSSTLVFILDGLDPSVITQAAAASGLH